FGDEQVNCLAFAPRGRQLVSWEEGSTLRLWDSTTGKLVRKWSASDDTTFGGAASLIYQIAFSRDGKRVLCGTTNGAIDVWDHDKGKRVARWVGHNGRSTALAIAPLGGLVASGGADHTVRLWEQRTGKEVSPRVEPTSPVLSVSASSSAPLLAVAL